jgi:cupin 2 domain-containing protein
MRYPTVNNIFSALPAAFPDECFETIVEASSVRIERITSCGQITPEGEWYDQGRDEWVLVLDGSAEILIENEPVPLRLSRGDHLLLPAGCRHRVTWTDPAVKTIWLAVHYDSGVKQ